MFWDPWLTPSSFHGVTSVVAGNCGFSIAPIRPELVSLLARTLQHVEDMSFDTLSVGVPWDEFETFPQYLDAVERRGTSLNYGCYVGHTAVRMYVMGEESYERAATPEELARMQAVVAESMAAGAMGFASSASPTHNGDGGRPVPSRVADLDELRALLVPVHDARQGGGGPAAGRGDPQPPALRPPARRGPAHHLDRVAHGQGLPVPREGGGRERRGAARRGRGVAPGVVPTARVPDEPGRALHPEHPHQLLQAHGARPRAAQGRLPRPGVARRDVGGALGDGGGGLPFNWPSVSVAESASHPELVDRGVVEIAEERGCTPLDVILDISLDDDLKTRFWSVLANNDPDGIAWLLPRDNVLLGLADSGAHVSQLCDACFATDLLGNWVRDRGVMSLERAVHKLTAEPAGVYGLTDRGSVEVGKAADLCVFDPDTVAPGPLRRVYDFPADGERLTADQPVGMTHVLVNGVPIRLDGGAVPDGLDSRPGKLLRS